MKARAGRKERSEEERSRTKRRAAAYAHALRVVASRHQSEFLEEYRAQLRARGLHDHPRSAEV